MSGLGLQIYPTLFIHKGEIYLSLVIVTKRACMCVCSQLLPSARQKDNNSHVLLNSCTNMTAAVWETRGLPTRQLKKKKKLLAAHRKTNHLAPRSAPTRISFQLVKCFWFRRTCMTNEMEWPVGDITAVALQGENSLRGLRRRLTQDKTSGSRQ